MNKAQVEVHGDVIKWFCTGDNADKGVYGHNPFKNKWILEKDPKFHTELQYVQNDQYAELRMAQADGKVIERMTPNGNWNKIGYEVFHNNVHNYRIKPDEPKFKVGQYVKVPAWSSSKGSYKALAIITSINPYKVHTLENGWQSCTSGWDETESIHKDIELWQPTEGEPVCVNNSLHTNWTIVEKYDKDFKWKFIYPIEFAMTLKDKK